MMNIFFSWQSDLPYKENKNFIEDCIKTAIKELNHENKHLVDFLLDKDTSGEPGNPEIISVILEKIDRCRVFICDLTVINSKYEGRKLPNPNVIFELGYAIKSLGWEKVICVVNEEFGKSEELPFDMKHRRMLSYNLSKRSKSGEKRKIVDAIKFNIQILKDRGLLFDELEDYIKQDVDTEFLTIINHIRKIVFQNINKNILLDTDKMLNLNKNELILCLENREILGFHLFKNFIINSNSIKRLIDVVIANSNYRRDKIVVLVKFKEWLDGYNKITGDRYFEKPFLELKSSNEFKIIRSNLSALPNRLILGKIVSEEKIAVYDFGDIVNSERIKKACTYFIINQTFIEHYVNLIFNFIEIANMWLDRTGGEFILDSFNQFEIK